MKQQVETKPPQSPFEEATLRDRISKSIKSKTHDHWAKILEVSSNDISYNPASTKVLIQSILDLAPGNWEMALDNLVKLLHPVLEVHQRQFEGEVKVKIKVINGDGPNRDLPVKQPSRCDRALTRSEIKKLRKEIKDELYKVGIKSPVITLIFFEFEKEVRNVAIVRADLGKIHYPVMRQIHEKYKPEKESEEYKKRLARNDIFAEVWFASRPGSSDSESVIGVRDPKLKQRPLPTSSNLLIQPDYADSARKEMDMLINANHGRVKDWRQFVFTGIDTLGTQKPEDTFHAFINTDGTSGLHTAYRSILSDSDYFKYGVDSHAMGIETKFINGEVEVVDIELPVLKLNHWLSSPEADKTLNLINGQAATGQAHLDNDFYNELFRLSLTAGLSASHSLSIGAIVKNAAQDEAKTGQILLSASGIVSELINMNQRALAKFLTEREVPVLVNRIKFDFSHLSQDFKKLFGETGVYYLDELGGKNHETILSILREDEHFTLLDKIGLSMVQAQCGKKGRCLAISSVHSLDKLDRAPFKPGHGTVMWKVNQLQAAALTLGKRPFTRQEMEKLALEVNKSHKHKELKNLENLDWVKAKEDQLRRSLYSSFLPV
jgi:hypothetical protein